MRYRRVLWDAAIVIASEDVCFTPVDQNAWVVDASASGMCGPMFGGATHCTSRIREVISQPGDH